METICTGLCEKTHDCIQLAKNHDTVSFLETSYFRLLSAGIVNVSLANACFSSSFFFNGISQMRNAQKPLNIF